MPPQYDAGALGVDAFDGSATNYPFVVSTPLDAWLEDLHVSSIEQPVESLWMTWISGLGDIVSDAGVPPKVHDVDLLLQDELASLIWDTRSFPTFSKALWYGDRYVCRWESETTVIVAVCRISPEAKSGYRITRGLLDPRVTDWRTSGVRDVLVWNGTTYVSAVRSDGTVRLRSGYNAEFQHERLLSERGEFSQNVIIDFVPGSGQGRFPGCGDGVGIRSLGGAIPNELGDLSISGDACISITPTLTYVGNTATIVPGEFTLYDGCEAGCRCEDFTDLYQYVTRTWNRYVDLASRASAVRDEYHVVREYLEDFRRCAEKNTLRVFVWPIRGCTVAVAIGLCNPSDEAVRDVVIDFTITDGADVDLGGSALCQSIHRVDFEDGQQMPIPYYFENPLPTGRMRLRCVPPRSMGYVVFQATLPGALDGGTVKVCGFCPVGMPPPLQVPEQACAVVDLVCKEPENCAGATTEAPTTTVAPTTTGEPTTTGAPTTTAP